MTFCKGYNCRDRTQSRDCQGLGEVEEGAGCTGAGGRNVRALELFCVLVIMVVT